MGKRVWSLSIEEMRKIPVDPDSQKSILEQELKTHGFDLSKPVIVSENFVTGAWIVEQD